MVYIRHRRKITYKDDMSMHIENIKHVSSEIEAEKTAKMHSNVNVSDNFADIEGMCKSEHNEKNIDDNTSTTCGYDQQSEDDDYQIEGELKPYNNTKTIENITPHEGDV